MFHIKWTTILLDFQPGPQPSSKDDYMNCRQCSIIASSSSNFLVNDFNIKFSYFEKKSLKRKEKRSGEGKRKGDI
jgi:hypothetical protein